MKKEHIVKSYDKDLGNLRNLLIKILDLNYNQLNLLYFMTSNKDTSLAQKIVDNDDKINLLDLELVQLSLNILSLRNPLAQDLRFVFSSSHISKNSERIGDYTKNAAKKLALVESHSQEVEIKVLNMIHLVMVMIKDTIDELKNDDIDNINSIIDKDLEVDALYEELSSYVIDLMIENRNNVACYTNYLNIARFLERVGDHIVNICTNISYNKRGTFLEY